MANKFIFIGLLLTAIAFGVWQYGEHINSECEMRYEKAMKDNANKTLIDERKVDKDVEQEVVSIGRSAIREWLRTNSTYKD